MLRPSEKGSGRKDPKELRVTLYVNSLLYVL